MGHSPLLGATSAPLEPEGRDTAALGPGDSSDTGADRMGLAADDPADRLDAEAPEATDIGVDRIVGGPDAGDEAEDADLAFIDDAQATDPLDDEDEAGDDETPVDRDAGRPPEKNPVTPPVARSGRRRR